MEETFHEKKGINWTSVAILASIAGFFAVIIILAILGIDLGQLFVSFVKGFKNAAGPEWGVFMVILAVFIISIFGNLTVIFPIPYTIALGIIVIFPEFENPLNLVLLAIFAGLGAAIGEIAAYLVGRGGAKALKDTHYGKSFENLKDKVERGWAIPLMFLFAATPIPDDPLLIVLGIVGYSLATMTIVYIIGKITFCFYISILMRIGTSIPIVVTILDLFNLNPFEIWLYDKFGIPMQSDPIMTAITWIATLLVIILLFFVDWKGLIKKLRGKTE